MAVNVNGSKLKKCNFNGNRVKYINVNGLRVWADWDGELYDSGDKFVDVTGGWSANGYTGLTCDAALDTGTDFTFSIPTWHKIGTVNKIDVTQYSTITFKMYAENKNTGVHYVYCGTYNNKSDQYNTGRTAKNSQITYTADSYGNFDVTVDVSRLSGRYYIAAYIYAQTNAISIWQVKMI